ncbi:MAG: hypothetical protein AB8F74_12910 [Saprospiraceae bacterium]
MTLRIVLILLCAGWFSNNLIAQESGFRLRALDAKEKIDIKKKVPFHGHLQPAVQGLDKKYLTEVDSLPEVSKWTFNWNPVIDLESGFQVSDTTKPVYGGMAGVRWQYTDGQKWNFEGVVAGYGMESPAFQTRRQDSLGILPGLGYSKSANGLDSYGLYATGKIGYTAKKYFSFELGRDRHFWGDGYRSLILSHNAAPYPYFKINTDIWKIRYINIWAQMRDFSRGEALGDFNKKFVALHALSWNFHKKWNITLYEMVVWQAEDKLSNRGLDLNYLNPVIFFRPIEFNLGSADNEIVGLSARFNPNNRNQIYTQLLLDEFLFDKLVDRSGWWANKFGVQLGWKTFDIITENLDFQTEINYVRPFTYTHGSVLQNYGHENQSLAHPLGANFIEWNNHIVYRKKDWELRNEFIWAIYGRDRDGDNYGGDIFTSYKSPFKIENNYIAQGLKSTLLFNKVSFEKSISKWKDFRWKASYTVRYENSEFEKQLDHFISFGITCNPLSFYRDF